MNGNNLKKEKIMNYDSGDCQAMGAGYVPPALPL